MGEVDVMAWGVLIALTIVWMALLSFLQRWRRTGCRCGRERFPWFHRSHVKDWVRWLAIVLLSVTAVLKVLWFSEFVDALLLGLMGVWQAKALSEHRKGKRSILGRLWGRVVVTEYGTLAVEHG